MRISYGVDTPDELARVEALEPADRLREIQGHLERCEPVPPALARWLGAAIQRADGDGATLLLGLKLRRSKGRPRRDDWFELGEAVLWMEADLGREGALAAVLDANPDVERSTLQRWRDEAHAAMNPE